MTGEEIIQGLLKKYPWLRDLQRLIADSFVTDCPGSGHACAGCGGAQPKLELVSPSDPGERLCLCADCFEGFKSYVWRP